MVGRLALLRVNERVCFSIQNKCTLWLICGMIGWRAIGHVYLCRLRYYVGDGRVIGLLLLMVVTALS